MRLINYNPQVSSFDRVATLHDLLTANSFGAQRGPALDVHEDAERITVRLEAPGLKKENFEISLHGGELTVAGERKAEVREGEVLRNERFHGRFSRTVSLATPVKSDEVSATYEDGVLSVVLPKSEEAKPRKIVVG